MKDLQCLLLSLFNSYKLHGQRAFLVLPFHWLKEQTNKKLTVFENTDVKKVFMYSRQHLRDGVNTVLIFKVHRTKKILKNYCPDTNKILFLQISANVSLFPLPTWPWQYDFRIWVMCWCHAMIQTWYMADETWQLDLVPPLVSDAQGVLMCSSALPILLLHYASASHPIALRAQQTYSSFLFCFVYFENQHKALDYLNYQILH